MPPPVGSLALISTRPYRKDCLPLVVTLPDVKAPLLSTLVVSTRLPPVTVTFWAV